LRQVQLLRVLRSRAGVDLIILPVCRNSSIDGKTTDHSEVTLEDHNQYSLACVESLTIRTVWTSSFLKILRHIGLSIFSVRRYLDDEYQHFSMIILK